MIFVGLKNCDTCRKALTAIRAKGIEPEVIDVRADGVPPEMLAEIIATFGEAAINKRSTTWRGLDGAARGGDVAQLLTDHPTLIKRPVIRKGADWHQGWTPAVQAAVLD